MAGVGKGAAKVANKGVTKIDEFAFVLLAGVVMIFVLTFAWTTPMEWAPTVEPSSIDLSVQRGASKTFDLTIKGKLTAVNLTATDEIKNWLAFDKKNFDVVDSAIVTVTVKVPGAVSLGSYEGYVEVESVGGKETVYVKINVIEEAEEEAATRIIPLGDFSVSYSEGADTLDLKESVEVVNGYFASHEIVLVGILTDEKLSIVTDGYIQLIIESTNSAGDLIVLLNGEEIFRRRVGVGEVLIPIDKTLIRKSNSVTIAAGSPGWKFWMNTVHRLRSAKFVVNYKGAFSKQFTFSLDANEVANLKHLKLFYRVKRYSAVLPELMIKINGQIVYWETPPLAFFDDAFEEDMLGNKLQVNVGNNTITFLFEREAYYDIADAILTVVYWS